MNYINTNSFIAHTLHMCIHIGTPTGAEDQGGHQLEVSELECANYEPNQGKPRSMTYVLKFSLFSHTSMMYCAFTFRSCSET